MSDPLQGSDTGLSTDALRASAVEQAALVRRGEVSARDLVEASLVAIERLDPSVNAFAFVSSERALAEAEMVRPHDPRPLCGVPLAVKDLLGATEGLPSTQGSSAFGDWIADHDTAHVRRLRAAGAIVVGKTTTPELGLRPVTESVRFGVTRNPRKLDLGAGGSSGGSAAAVAAGMVSLAEGSDLGGSIRIPSACCGVVGFKPSRGRVSIGPDFGDLGGGAAADGPIARTVLDAALALDVMAGYEPGDHHWLTPPPRTYVETTRGPLPEVAVLCPSGRRWTFPSIRSHKQVPSVLRRSSKTSAITYARGSRTGTTRRFRPRGRRSSRVPPSTWFVSSSACTEDRSTPTARARQPRLAHRQPTDCARGLPRGEGAADRLLAPPPRFLAENGS